jgi:hypothetical protein
MKFWIKVENDIVVAAGQTSSDTLTSDKIETDTTNEDKLGMSYVNGVFGGSDTSVREERDALLVASDDSMLQLLDDATSWTNFNANRAAYKTYRQELRDIPDQVDFPTTVTWPVKPIA